MKLFSIRKRQLIKRVEACRQRLYSTAYVWCQDASVADDLTQETLAKALGNLRSLKKAKALEPWLFRILNNCWCDHLRRKVNVEDLDFDLLINETTPLDQQLEKEVLRKVKDSMALLPVGSRQVITMVDIEGYTYIETAEILDIPIGTVMSRLARGRNRLREMLSSYIGNDKTVNQSPKLRSIK